MLYSWNGVAIEACIESLNGNEQLKEYEREVTGNHCEATLECVEGEYVVSRSQACQGRYECRAWVDGRELRDAHWRVDRRSTTLRSMRVRQGDEVFEGDLQFAPLMKTEDEDLVDVKGDALRHLGTIKIEVQQGILEYQHKDPSRRRKVRAPRGEAASVGYVRETEHKLGCAAEATNLRPLPHTGEGGNNGHWRFLPDIYHPTVCTFTFRYHTRTKLIILGVIEDPTAIKTEDSGSERSDSPHVRTPSLTAFYDDVPVGVKRELSYNEAEEEEDDIEEVKRVKLEDRSLGSAYQPIEVSEVTHRRRSIPFILPTSGVIDLTDD